MHHIVTDRIASLDLAPPAPRKGLTWRLHPCGECHLKPDEVCDICGAENITPEQRLSRTNEQLQQACILITRAMCSLTSSDFGGAKVEAQQLHKTVYAAHRHALELLATWDARSKARKQNAQDVLRRAQG